MKPLTPSIDCRPLLAPRATWLAAAALALWMPVLGAQEVSESQRASVQLQLYAGDDGAVELSWPPPPGNFPRVSTSIYRRPFPPRTAAGGWGEPVAVREGGAGGFLDTPPPSAQPWEYRVVTLEAGSGRTAYGYGVVAASAAARSAELDPRKGVLVILKGDAAAGQEPDFATALSRLTSAWQAEGWVWQVEYVDGPASGSDEFGGNPAWTGSAHTPLQIRQLVGQSAQRFRSLGVELKSILLIGRVPVPYAGNFAPDGHGDHWGAWPADLYYGDLDGAWPDERDFPPRAADPRQHNVAGDGKLDWNELPGPVEVSVGRVDFSQLAALDLAGGATAAEAKSREQERIVAWLHRAADWHEGRYPVAGAEVLVHDLMPENAEAFATTPWRLAPTLQARGNLAVNPLRVPMLGWGASRKSVLFGFGYAPGTYTSAMGIASSSELLRERLGIPFVFLFGSYFGDWDAPGNLLQAALGNPDGGVLATSWAARPVWQLHPMAAGYTLGECQLLTANRTQDYLPGMREAFPLHLALLGDTTLQLYPLPEVVIDADLRWNADQGQDIVARPPALEIEPLGWHVYQWKQGEQHADMVPVRITQFPLPLSTNHFERPAVAGDWVPLGSQVRLLYRITTPAGKIERLGPGRLRREGANR